MDGWKSIVDDYLILISRLSKDREPHSGQVALISENSIIDPSGASLIALITVVGKKKPDTCIVGVGLGDLMRNEYWVIL